MTEIPKSPFRGFLLAATIFTLCQKEYRIPCRGLCPPCDRIAAFFAGDFTSFNLKSSETSWRKMERQVSGPGYAPIRCLQKQGKSISFSRREAGCL